MRTTVTLDDDVAAAVNASRTGGESFGAALNRLVRRGLRPARGGPAPELPILAGNLKTDITDVSAVLADLDEATPSR